MSGLVTDVDPDFNSLFYLVIPVVVIEIDPLLDPELELGITMLDLFRSSNSARS